MRMPRTSPFALYATRMKPRRALTGRYGCAWYADAKTLLEKERPQLVSVCLPTYLHREYTVMALLSGAHVLCEKPLALTIEDCEAIA